MARMRIDVGASVGVDDRARNDGLVGTLVTLTSLDPGQTHEFELLWAPIRPPDDPFSEDPEPDPDSIASLVRTSATTFTFTPGRYGAYRIQLVVDRGLPTQSISRRRLGVPSASGLVAPAFGELADPRASVLQNGPEAISASENNEANAWWGWQLFLEQLAIRGGAGVLWRWNGVDLTQFEGSFLSLDPAGGSVAGTPAVSVEEGQFGRPVIRLSSTGGVQGLHFLRVLASELELPFRYVVRLRYQTYTVSGIDVFAGFLPFYSDTEGNGLVIMQRPADVNVYGEYVDATELNLAAVTMGSGAQAPGATAADQGGIEHEVYVDVLAGSEGDPLFSVIDKVWTPRGELRSASITSETDAPAGWSFTFPERFGLGLGSAGAANNVTQFDVESFEILAHPKDR